MIPQTPGQFGCIHCGRTNFTTRNALRQHLKQGFCAKIEEHLKTVRNQDLSPMSWANENVNSDQDSMDYGDNMPYLPVETPPRKQTRSRFDMAEIPAHDMDALTRQMGGIFNENDSSDEDSLDNTGNFDYIDKENRRTGDDAIQESTSSDEENSESGSIASDSRATGNNSGPDTWIRDQFREYCAHARENFLPFTEHEVRTIRLLHLLKEKNSPMNAFEPVMLWHLKEANLLREHQGLGDYQHYIGRKTMIKRLLERYNFENKMPFQRAIRLPVSGTFVRLTVHDCRATIQRLLTDPRHKAKDYLFWDGDPLAPPPENLDYVADLNTGLAFIQTYHLLIHGKREQLCPINIYSDGTAVSHFHDMELTQVNIALGIMTREARNQAHCWAPLGYIEKVHEQGGRGKTILEEANHMETQDGYESAGSDDSFYVVNSSVGTNNAQDFHAMMALILQPFLKLQETGFIWDHYDRIHGKLWPDIHYKIFVPFVKADSKEADLFAGKYAQRFSAQQICRKCHVPLRLADDHMAKYKPKTVTEIKKLVAKGDLPRLKALSQTYLVNAFHDIRFSLGNDAGIHGSCPSEMLHAFLLGTFKYLRDIFFEMVGSSSEGARLMNALAQVYSKMFARQSDRTMPGTAFTRGIQVGKLMAKDYRGVLLIILAMLRSTKGRSVLSKYNNFKNDSDLDDWILLVELMLEWESYLNEPLMYVKHVKRMERKNRYIMYIMRKVAQRTKGMGLKLTKFHMILHIWEDILQFGVPLEFDTSANESMHKPSKKASKMTQKAAETFNIQTATRLIEFELLNLAMEEIQHGKVPWNYYQLEEESPTEAQKTEEEEGIWTGETRIQVGKDEDGEVSFNMSTKSKFADKTSINTALLEFLNDLQDMVYVHIGEEFLPIFTCHRRKGQTFRGHPNFRGKGPWRDWVWVNWGQDGRYPAHIWCFVSLQGLPTGRHGLTYGGTPLRDGVFAVVETATVEANEDLIVKSDLMIPVCKEVDLDEDGNVTNRTFYLADTEAFEDPCCVVPDLGGPSNRYFVVKPRNQWADLFIAWLEDPHRLDEMDAIENVEVDDNVLAKLDKDRPKGKHKNVGKRA